MVREISRAEQRQYGRTIRLYRKSDQHRYQEQTKPVPSATPQVAVSQPEPGPPPQVEFFYNRMDQVGFIRKPAVQPLGRIFSVVDNKEMISPGDIVYLSPNPKGPSADFAPGARFTVYRTLSPTPKKNSVKTIGTQHLLLGVVEVTQKEADYAIAKVIDSFRPISVGDLLMEYRERTPDLIVSDSTPGMAGTLISSEEHNKLIGSNFTAFIDKGKRDNIHEGQQYTIVYQETKKGVNGKTIKLAPVDLGSFIVLHTEETTSTVYVTQAFGKIEPGQPFITP